MRIISSFRDYYDGIQTYGQDRSLIYHRVQEEDKDFVSDRIPALNRGFWTGMNHPRLHGFTVGFCGRIYAGVRATLTCHTNKGGDQLIQFCYTPQEVADFYRANCPKRYTLAYTGERPERRRQFFADAKHEDVEAFFKEHDDRRTEFAELFNAKRCPVWLAWDEGHARACGYLARTVPKDTLRTAHRFAMTYNATLSTVEFIRVIDPYTAFQEIQMFLGNMAQPEKPIPKISDEVMAEIKGFDKFSFRKDPAKGKK